MIEIQIDGQILEAQPGETIIQVADKAGIYIPRFCYHKKLSVVASCRMCLVEVEKAPKTLPACATPVMPGMKVNTRSEKALFSQKTVMEFLLINHPLDCPICDQGGECELQDLSLGYGNGISRFTEGKRAVHDENLGPLISTEMTRCIQCTRCVRLGDEVAGVRELGAMGRGEDVEIATYVEKAVSSELSGNMIDVCPVGALTSKPYRFTARAWELSQCEAIAPHDCLGSNIYIHTRGEEYTPVRHVMRVVPRENESINEVWLSDRDRFSYEAINSADRLLNPLLKRDGEWITVDWETALNEVVKRLQAVTQNNQIGALVSPNSTTEECYLLQKLMHGLGSHHIDYRIRQSDFSDAHINAPHPVVIADLEKLNSVLLVGSNIRFEQPLAAQRLRKAVKQGASVMCVNPADYALNFNVAEKCIAGAHDFVTSLAKILKILNEKLTEQKLPADLVAYLDEVTLAISDCEIVIAEKLLAGEHSAIVLGAYATQHTNAAMVHALTRHIAELSQSQLHVFTEGANSAGAYIAGAIPDQSGFNAREMLEKNLPAYVLLGVEPELDSAYPALALAALKQAQLVISFSAFQSAAIQDYADIILPMATFVETAGTYINVEGKWQSMQAVTLPMGEAKAAWEVLRDLGRLLALPGFDAAAVETICDELKASQKIAVSPEFSFAKHTTKTNKNTLYRVGQWPIYRVDSLVRHAPALQATMAENTATIRINSKLAAQLNLTEGAQVTATQGNSSVSLPLVIDEHIADNQVWIPAGLDVTAGFGEIGAEVELKCVHSQ
jgi:NADH-quinone oxidoreductase subunit G